MQIRKASLKRRSAGIVRHKVGVLPAFARASCQSVIHPPSLSLSLVTARAPMRNARHDNLPILALDGAPLLALFGRSIRDGLGEKARLDLRADGALLQVGIVVADAVDGCVAGAPEGLDVEHH